MIFASITRSDLFQPVLAHQPSKEGVEQLALMSVCENPPTLSCIEDKCPTCKGNKGKDLFTERLAGTLINQDGDLNEAIEYFDVATGPVELPISDFIEVRLLFNLNYFFLKITLFIIQYIKKYKNLREPPSFSCLK